MLAVGGAIACAALAWGEGNPPYALVFPCVLAGIYAANGQMSRAVKTGCVVAAMLTVTGMIAGLCGQRFTHRIDVAPR